VCAGLGLAALGLVTGLRAGSLAHQAADGPAALSSVGAGLRTAVRQPRLRLMLLLLTAEAVMIGALDLLFVVLAVDVLGRPQAWVGYLNAAYGVGGALAALAGVLLIGRRLGAPILAAGVLLSAALAALAAGLGTAGTLALLVAVGASRTLLDVASRSLLQRSVPAELLGRVFGLLEGLDMAGLAAGSLLVPALVHLGGARAALLGVAAVLPLAAVVGGRGLFSLDSGARVPVVEMALLRSIALFAELPPPAIEGLAASIAPVELPAGTVLLRQGDPGDAYYAIADGYLDVTQDGRLLRRCGRGEGVGEIALLRATSRTATVTASVPSTVYRLGRDEFLTAVLGHAATQRQAHRIADDLLASDAAGGSRDTGDAGA
jgi:MFS family permease